MFLKKRPTWMYWFFTAVLCLGVILFLTRGNTRTFATLPLGEKNYNVVLSQTTPQITLGLSYRRDIGADGMLFLLPARDTPMFWMFEMRFPLDFIWIDQNTVVSLNENVSIPQVGASQSEIPRVQPTQPVTAVLEVPAGFIQRESIKIGTPVGQVTEMHTKMW